MKDKKNIIIIILLLLLMGVGYYYSNRTGNLSEKLELEVKLKEALLDSVEIFETENGELVAEKRTLQGDINDLLKENSGLSDKQRDLLQTINRLNKEWKKDREIFAAARIEYEKLIDSLNRVIADASFIDTTKNLVKFAQSDSGAHFIYDLDILGVRPYPLNTIPKVRFNMVDFPNTQTITFNWDKNERKDYPVSFTVENSNKYYKVHNIESYAIPELQKDVVDPTKRQKVWKWLKMNGKYILVGAAGFTIGAAVK